MIRPVSYATILYDPNAASLLAEYAAECSIPALGVPSPQRDLYAMLEASGGFQAFGVYDGDVLVGFASVLIYALPHYGQKIATTESIFISESQRGMGHGLLGYLNEYARENGCVAFLYTAPQGSRFDRMMSVMDEYSHTNNVYLRSL